MKIPARRAALTLTLTAALSSFCLEPLSAQPGSGGQAGDFDFYVLALSVAPSFCDVTGFNEQKSECTGGSDAAYQAVPLTVHGLWPNKEGLRPKEQPRHCTDEPPGQLPGDLSAQLQKYMPGVADGLDKSEWNKHGTCSGLSYEQYYRAIVALASLADASIGGALRESGKLGATVQLSDLIAAVAVKNPELARAITVDCQYAHPHLGGPSRAYIVELRILIAKDLTGIVEGQGPSFVAIDSEGFHLNSGCPAGAGFLPGGFGD